jgi:hypothetical protein
MEMAGMNDETGFYDSMRLEQIQEMSDYLWYSLDQWGKDNSASEQPQCMTASDCFGSEYATEKCCASISMGADEEAYYMYRCLDMGLVGMNMDFSIGDDVQVNVKCDEGSVSAAVALAATATAAAAAIATVF